MLDEILVAASPTARQATNKADHYSHCLLSKAIRMINEVIFIKLEIFGVELSSSRLCHPAGVHLGLHALYGELKSTS